jgi:hypothetical protein
MLTCLGGGKSDFANTRSVVVGHFSMYTFNLNRFVLGGLWARLSLFCICRVLALWLLWFREGVMRLTNTALICFALYCIALLYMAWRGVAWHGRVMAWHIHIAWRVACKPQWGGLYMLGDD